MMRQLTILIWKEWRQHRLSLAFLLFLIPACLYSGILLFGPATPSGTLALMGSAAGGSYLIGLLAFTGELWVGEQRTRGLAFLDRLPCSPEGPTAVKWLWALVAPLLLGLYGLLVGYIAVLVFGRSGPLGGIFVTERGMAFLLFGVSFGFWMLAMGRLLPRTGVGILVALLMHVGPVGTWALLPALLQTSGSFPDILTLLIPMALVGAILAATLPILLSRHERTRTWCFGGLGALLLLSSGAGIVHLWSAYDLDPEDARTTITQAEIGHGERYALVTCAGPNTEESYLLDLQRQESRRITHNYHRRTHPSRYRTLAGIPARRTWKAVSKQALPGMHPSTLLIERGESHGRQEPSKDDRLLDLEHGVLLAKDGLGIEPVQALISLSHRRASPLILDDGRRIWGGADGVLMAAQEGKPGHAWKPDLLAGATSLRGRGLQILLFAPDGGKATMAWLDPSRERIFRPGEEDAGMQVGLIRRGSWIVRMRVGKDLGPWQLWDPETRACRPLFATTGDVAEDVSNERSVRSATPPLAMTGDDRILYMDADMVLRTIDAETGAISVPRLIGTSATALWDREPGRRDRPWLRHLGRIASGLDIYQAGIRSEVWRYFAYDSEHNEVRLAPRSLGRPTCVGKQAVYFRSANKLYRWDFTRQKPELLFPTPAFRDNPQLGTPSTTP